VSDAAAAARFTVRLEPAGRAFETSEDVSLLEAAELAGILMPSSCRNGTCRTCIARLADGHVRYAIEWPGLLREEKDEGWILPCVAHATSDLVIVAPAAR
jgi:ferredoxin